MISKRLLLKQFLLLSIFLMEKKNFVTFFYGKDNGSMYFKDKKLIYVKTSKLVWILHEKDLYV